MSRKHPLFAFQLLLSLFLQTAAYYGFRAIIFLYLMQFFPNDHRRILWGTYAWLSTGIVLAGVLGGYAGDRFAGHRRVSLAGVVLQAAGLFLMAVPGRLWAFAGLAVMALGSGLYKPNLMAQYAGQYGVHSRLLDAGMLLWFLMINFGGLFGPMVVELRGYNVPFSYIFFILGLLMLLAGLPVYELKDTGVERVSSYKASRRGQYIIVAAVLLLIYKMFSDYGYQLINRDLIQHLTRNSFRNELIKEGLEFFGWVVLSVYLFFRWTRTNKSSWERVIWAFVLGGLALGLYGLYPGAIAGQHKHITEISFALLMLSGIFLAPLWSVVIRIAPARHLALWISLISVYQWLIGYFIFMLPDYREASKGLFVAGFVISLITAAGLFYWARSEKTPMPD